MEAIKLRVNRLKINVQTTDGVYDFDEHFDKKLNFIASFENTKGKSSCIESIFYCLGVEELIGGSCEKALKPVFRKVLINNSREHNVIDTYFLLEIQNQESEVITIYRTANKENFSSKLIRVYFSSIDNMNSDNTKYEDMYLHSKGSATNTRGFHTFLESFIKWKLPEVPSFSNEDTKLYLQTIFSGMFIEQKRGWSDFLSTIPTYFKIKEPKKRVIEFILNLDSLESEKLKQGYKTLERRIKNDWTLKVKLISELFGKIGFSIEGIPASPETLEDLLEGNIKIFQLQNDEKIALSKYMEILNKTLSQLLENKKTVNENLEELQNEYTSMSNYIKENEMILKELQEKILFLKESIKGLTENLEIVNKDIINNKDVLKLKRLGSTSKWNVTNNNCPTCHQHIEDSLLLLKNSNDHMSIEENLQHLNSQKDMLEFARNSYIGNFENLQSTLKKLGLKLQNQRKILRSISKDLISNENNFSETVIMKRLIIENEIENIKQNYTTYKEELTGLKILIKEWKELTINKKEIPDEGLTKKDLKILNTLRENFIENLVDFGYSSIDTSSIQISQHKLLPIIEGFDMKFDSSASDNIRGIWAYTLALLQTSAALNGNHPKILIFDEPDQQSVVLKDMKNFLEKLQNLKIDSQIIIGITIKEDETKELIQNLDKEKCKVILLNDRALTARKIENSNKE